ncbi:tetratricopeptide repeat protein [Rhodospirillales bacterium]|nr:tetratricopeptide repeat protein [Rhodospirillales bacterium]
MIIEQFEQPGTPDVLQLKHTEAYYNHGNRLVKLGRLDDAIVYYLKALDIKPNLIKVYTNLGKVLLRWVFFNVGDHSFGSIP